MKLFSLFLLVTLVSFTHGQSLVDISNNFSPPYVGGELTGFSAARAQCINKDPFHSYVDSAQCPVFRNAPGVLVDDIDGDGCEDIYVSNGAGASNRLYINDCSGSFYPVFTDTSASAGVEGFDHDSSGVCGGDINNDGIFDLYVVSFRGSDRLYLGVGGGGFSDISDSSGIAAMTAGMHGRGCTVGDFDNDGYVDLYVGNAFDPLHKEPIYIASSPTRQANTLMMNNGDLTFRLSLLHDINETLITWGVIAYDWNQDGATDIMYVNDQAAVSPIDPQTFQLIPGADQGRIVLLQNDGSGNMVDISTQVGLKSTVPFLYAPNLQAWMGTLAADLDCNGKIDTFHTNLGAHDLWYVSGSAATQGNQFLDVGSSRWYNLGANDQFTTTFADGLKTPFGWGEVATDYDLDGDMDIIFVGGMFWGYDTFSSTTPLVVLQNAGLCSGHFVRDTSFPGQADRLSHDDHALGVGDLNGDGSPDFVMASEADWPANAVRVRHEDAAPVPYPFPPNPFEAEAFFFQGDMIKKDPGCWGPAPCLYEPYPAGTLPTNGSLGVYISDGATTNGFVALRMFGGKGFISGGGVNRLGIGAIAYVTPTFLPGEPLATGVTVTKPIVAGESCGSQNSLRQIFGLGAHRHATVEILWPGPNGGTKNYHARLTGNTDHTLYEIPCDTRSTSLTFDQYVACANGALNEYKTAGEISEHGKGAMLSDAIAGWHKYH